VSGFRSCILLRVHKHDLYKGLFGWVRFDCVTMDDAMECGDVMMNQSHAQRRNAADGREFDDVSSE
jgi:hypothetical protein